MTKQALCIGINYPGTPAALQGCVNDAQDWAATLDRRGFDVHVLHNADATRAAVLSEIDAAVGVCDRDSVLVVTYSGHGTRVPDGDRDEVDGWDEALVPADYATAGMVLDDDLYRLFAPAEAAGVRVVFIADSCFSGTIQRLAPPWQGHNAEAGMRIDMGYRKQRWLPPAEWMPPDSLARATRAWTVPRGRPRRSAVALSACRDDQVTYDAYLDGRYRGAFTAAALTALDTVTLFAGQHPAEPVTYRDWHREIRTLLPSEDFDTQPQLDGTAWQKRQLILEPHGAR